LRKVTEITLGDPFCPSRIQLLEDVALHTRGLTLTCGCETLWHFLGATKLTVQGQRTDSKPRM
jgi:hypothetical protein